MRRGVIRGEEKLEMGGRSGENAKGELGGNTILERKGGKGGDCLEDGKKYPHSSGK